MNFANLGTALKAALVGTLLLAGTVLGGCEEGPLEETGEEVDDAIDDLEDQN